MITRTVHAETTARAHDLITPAGLALSSKLTPLRQWGWDTTDLPQSALPRQTGPANCIVGRLFSMDGTDPGPCVATGPRAGQTEWQSRWP